MRAKAYCTLVAISVGVFTISSAAATTLLPPDADLTLWNGLGSQAEIEASHVGPNGTYGAGGYTGTFTEGVVGLAFVASRDSDSGTGDFSQTAITFEAGSAINPQQGTIDLYAKLLGFPENNTFGGGYQPGFTWLDGHSLFGFSGNNGQGMSGLTGRIGNTTTGTGTVSYEGSIGADPAEWNRYTLVWNEDGLETPGLVPGAHQIALYVNGQLRSAQWNNEGGTLISPAEDALMMLAFVQGGYQTNGWDNVPGAEVVVDELRIYNSVVPEPTGLALCLSAMGILVRAGVRRHGTNRHA